MRRALFVTIAVLGVVAAGVAPAGAHEGHQHPGATAIALPGAAGSAGTTAAELGTFSQPFAEPGPNCPNETAGSPNEPTTARPPFCKPTAVSVVVLPNGKILYWNGLENMESNKHALALEYGQIATNDQSRVMDLHGSWQVPNPSDGGSNPNGYEATYLVPDAPPPLQEVLNHPGNAPGALFCGGNVLLRNGKLLTAGGTAYYSEPYLPGTPYGLVELEGLKNSRLFLPGTNRWVQSGWMHYGRWYPTLVTLGSGDVFVASGVTKLMKPFYPQQVSDSGRNVVQTETYDLETGRWRYNGTGADRSLPLFPRLHLLPDGKVFFNANGQTFNPFGQAYDEALWNLAAAYDPKTRTWSNLGVPTGGFIGSTFSVMLPLEAPYTKASFLSAGGILGVTPGTYFPTNLTRINTVDTANGDAFTSTLAGPMNNPRWYSTATVLPTGQVIAFSGADRDEVDFPGTGFPVTQAELFDPATGEWTAVASAHRGRTYHNTAVLLPDARVLVGGHSPIATMYGAPQQVPGGFSNAWRDPSFEIYSPPYLYWGSRPTIRSVPRSIANGATITVGTRDAGRIESVVLVRNPALTHLVDADQRVVNLKIVRRGAGSLTVKVPANRNVLPPGPYMLFVNAKTARGLVPSVSRQVFVGGPVPSYLQ